MDGTRDPSPSTSTKPIFENKQGFRGGMDRIWSELILLPICYNPDPGEPPLRPWAGECRPLKPLLCFFLKEDPGKVKIECLELLVPTEPSVLSPRPRDSHPIIFVNSKVNYEPLGATRVFFLVAPTLSTKVSDPSDEKRSLRLWVSSLLLYFSPVSSPSNRAHTIFRNNL